MRPRALRPALLVATLAGCSMVAPYPTFPLAREAKAPADPGPRVAICYNGLHSSLDEVRKQAQGECSAGTVATPVDTDYHLQGCPLLLPARASFACAPQK